mmetsp:Transcript_5436/g.13245  ORF Transcript_5436/g.13245 Transcript_5436/m.13245 type:complete len:107 (-) Transcript_5436:503-823(-)
MEDSNEVKKPSEKQLTRYLSLCKSLENDKIEFAWLLDHNIYFTRKQLQKRLDQMSTTELIACRDWLRKQVKFHETGERMASLRIIEYIHKRRIGYFESNTLKDVRQ